MFQKDTKYTLLAAVTLQHIYKVLQKWDTHGLVMVVT